MKHVAHFRKEFARWTGDEEKRSSFLQALAAVIHRHSLEGFAFSLNMDHYRQIDATLTATESFPPYALMAFLTVGKILEWQRRYRPDDAVLFLFERGDSGQGAVKDKLDREWEEIGIPQPIFMPKELTKNGVTRCCLPLQAADFLAYESNKTIIDFLTRGKIVVRESSFSLWYTNGVERAPFTMFFDWRFILNVIIRYGGKPR